ncbi:hypothetical protein HWV62_13868 [Athelia sp. TMB]|nr:hypothetical protein HWV62_13868 [Athelia sp. TMB]
MPNLRLAWIPLTLMVTVAIYLHLRGLSMGGTADQSPISTAEDSAPTDKRDMPDAEPGAVDEVVSQPDLVNEAAPEKALPDETAACPTEPVTIEPKSAEHRALAEEHPTVPNPEVITKAKALSDQSTRLHDEGKREEALTTTQEAVTVFRALAEQYPTTFNVDLAQNLRNLSSRLSNVGRREDALSAIEEAVDLHRALVVEHPAEFDAELASSLNHLSNRLYRLDRHDEALLAIQESVDLYRTLAENLPEAHNPGLAASLFNLCSRFSTYDLREEALAAIQESSSIYRDLTAREPNLYSKNLAASLKKLSGCLQGLDRQAEARETSQATANITNPQKVTSTRRAHIEAVFVPESLPGSSASHRGRAPSGSAFYAFGNKEVINVGGNYVTGDEEPVAKISRILPYAEGASWDSNLACLPGTRLAMLSILNTWAHGTGSKRICWVRDVAGSGKSAILHTIAEKLQREGLLGASFFFSRDTASRNNAKHLFTTIARDIANLHPGAAEDIASALESEPALASASLSRQFDALILGPCHHLPITQPVVFVIDALDESISHDHDTELLAVLRDKATQLPPQIRILISSRPTSTIEEYLSRASHIATHSIDIFSVENKRDIDTYVDSQMRHESILIKMGLASPDERVICDLKRLAEGLFVWIVTVCNFLRTAYKPKAKLQALLSKTAQHLPPERKMDELYAAILAGCGDWEDPDFLKDYRLVMGTIMAAKRPLSLAALRALHESIEELEAEQLLQRFGSVLVGFRDLHQPIRILHISFREFITGRAAQDASTNRFYLAQKAHSGRLGELCIKTLNRELSEPLIGAGYLNRDPRDPPLGIPRICGASEQLVYGCSHWTDHLPDIEEPQLIRSHIIPLISHHFVTWVEVVASTNIFRGSLAIRKFLQGTPELDYFLQDGSQASAMSALSHRLADEARLEEALFAAHEAVTLTRALSAIQPAFFAADLADALNNLSIRFATLGRVQEAFVAADEAVNLYRTLPVVQPAEFNAGFAKALANLSNHLSDLGRPQEALSVAQEAADSFRALTTERPGLYDADLAATLGNLSHRLSALGRASEALAASQEAIDLYRALSTQTPTAYSADLARVLHNLANGLTDFGRAHEALSAVQEAVDLYRILVTERPAAYTDALATTLSNLSGRLSDLGQIPEALLAIQEAVDLRRPLAAERPMLYNSHLAAALTNLSNRLSNIGRPQEALAAAQEAVSLYKAPSGERPATYSLELASALSTISNRLSDCGRPREALAAIEEAVDIHRALAKELPATYNAGLAMALNNLSLQLSALGRPQEALAAVAEAVDIYRALATERPAAHKASLATTLSNLSDRLSEISRPQEALAAVEEAVETYRALAPERPASFNPGLALAFNKLSDCLLNLGRPQEALAVVEKAVDMYRVLAAEQPGAYRAYLGMSLNSLSNTLTSLGRLREALVAVAEAVDIYRALCSDLPAAHNPKLAVALQNLSRRLMDLDQPEEALSILLEDVNIFRALAAEQPDKFKHPFMLTLAMLLKVLADLGLDIPDELSQEMIDLASALNPELHAQLFN